MAVGRWEAPASGTALPSSRILAGTNMQLKAKIIIIIIIIKAFILLYFSFFPPLFKLSAGSKAHAVCVCQSQLFQPGLTGAAKILQLPPVFCKQLARRWAALITLFLREMPKHTLTRTPQNLKISWTSRHTWGKQALLGFFVWGCHGISGVKPCKVSRQHRNEGS